jgi:pyruvate/2-oxoglutarate dehydrogenase complex dihydrolipoamide dehydrogenase (E3) component
MAQRVITIGAGSGGLTVAIGLAAVGYESILVERSFIGGDCTNFGCIPSKTLLHESQQFYQAHKLATQYLGITDGHKILQNSYKVLSKTREIRNKFRQHESIDWLEGLGIKVVKANAKFIDADNLKLENLEYFSKDLDIDQKTPNLSFDKAIIATGSRTFIPPIKGLENSPYLTNESIFEQPKTPKSMLVLGNGPIGIEMAESFTNLGCKVTVIGLRDEILPRSDKDLAKKLKLYLQNKGVSFESGQTTKVSFDEKTGFTLDLKKDSQTLKLQAQQLLVATGRQPNLELNLEKAKIKYTKKGIQIDSFGKTSNPKIYAIGDCCEVPRFTHFAYHMAKKVTTNLIFQKYTKLPINISKWDTKSLPAVTYTSIELAQAGLSQNEAEEKFGKDKVKVYTYGTSDSDRAKTYDDELFEIKLITTGFWGRIVGVHILGSRSGEILPEFQQMIENKKGIRQVDNIIRSYPTFTHSLDKLSREWMKGKL